jgi:hypothetical protein
MPVNTTIRMLVGLGAVTAAVAALGPVAHASSGYQGSPDAVDRAVAAKQAELAADFDAREHAQLRIEQPVPDAFERAAAAHELRTLDAMPVPDAFERAAAAGQLQYQPVTASTSTNGFDWGDFGLGAGTGVGLVLLLAGLALGAWIGRQGRRQMSGA